MKLTATKIAIVLGTASLAAGCSGGGGSAESMPTPPAAANSAPTISSIANQTIDEGDATSVLAFTVGDAETSADALTVSVSSSNGSMLPVGLLGFAKNTSRVEADTAASMASTSAVRSRSGALITRLPAYVPAIS